jgi:3-hydroxyisobutyrate dehydrogenase-like beta-hydroxyacid dehydrogenase
MTQIAFLGTGLLGAAFVEAACGRGESVTVWNRTRAKAEALAAVGARVADTPADAVRGAVRVHLVLTDDDAVEAVIDALRPGLAADTIIVDHTTTQPARTAARAARLADAGVRYLHCPVFIGPAAARLGQGTILASGPATLFEAVRPALERQAERVQWYGERPDLAAAYKLMGNCYILGIAALVADVFAIGKGAGVAAPDALALLDLFNATNIVKGRGAKMARGDFTASFELPMARKDVRLMMETAGALPLAVLPSLAARMDTAIAAGWSAEDFSVIAKDLL